MSTRSLSPGAVQLPTSHLSVRVPWHDTDWTGRVCRAPGENHSCTALRNIKEKKLYESEEEDSGKAWSELETDRIPPCALERGGFMRPAPFQLVRRHAYRFVEEIGFAPTTQHMPPYSVEAVPFRWMMREDFNPLIEMWGIEVDQDLESAADKVLGFHADWIQDHRNQLALLDSFFSALEPRKSLMFLYAKDIPLVEQPDLGDRFLIGVGFVDGIEPAVEWEYVNGTPGPFRSVMWERGVLHSIRPTFTDGFLLPYQQLLESDELQGEDLEPLIARAPREHFNEFSYVSELVSHDGAISALTELGRVLQLLPNVVEGPWDAASAWLNERLAEAWQARGPYPGLGAMLVAAGLERGPLIARMALTEEGVDKDGDPWIALETTIEENRGGLIGRVARKAWQKLRADEARYRQFQVMSSFALSVDQARRLFDSLDPGTVLNNPYSFFEADRRQANPVTFALVDRGLWPQDRASKRALELNPLPEPVTEAGDDRRVRAAAIDVLERAADQGHTLLDEPGLRKRLSNLQLTPPCDPPDAAFELAADDFEPLLVEKPLARDSGRGWQLDRLAQAGAKIESEIRERAARERFDLEWPWRERIDEAIGSDIPADDQLRKLEHEAREEKASALKILATSRISVLVGPAGTGKTTMLQALCADPAIAADGVLLLAPTGKARVQLSDRVRAPAKTMAQFLRPSGRWDELGYRMVTDAQRVQAGKTVIIDEASMLTEEMLAATLDALVGVERLVLCGDPHQLPPIGAGRPFPDIISMLSGSDAPGGGVARLTVARRQLPTAGDASRTRDDVAIASIFSIDEPLPSADDALQRAIAGDSDDTFRLVTWEDESDLHQKLVEILSEENPQLAEHSADALMCSLGAVQQDGKRAMYPWGQAGQGAEVWQLLSPVRARPGGVIGLNRLVRETWRPGDATAARRSRKLPPPMGADEVLFNDKVMCLRNDNREAYEPAAKSSCGGSVANGEIGIVVWSAGKKGKRPHGLKVEFSTQKGRQYTFWERELNGEDERWGELLELAYAITIHKSQGSQFKTTFVIVPDPCPLLSPELLYTALTRQRDRVVLLKQGDAADLRELGSPSRSETARRLTCLFRPADPFTMPDGAVVDGSHIHRTLRGELVRSKSELIIAEKLSSLGIDYAYEVELTMSDGTKKLPDFTIIRDNEKPTYWEHLGMLNRPGYRADWEAKKQWYADHSILPWKEGGGPQGTLVWSTESVNSPGIDAQELDSLAREVFDL